ncbi:MAG: F0F1 ATP synthase subunit I [Halomonadaceae bacterium]|nr:MAG: F0F1 ATP synthase subunit I [Halomonadaceae bacterium]
MNQAAPPIGRWLLLQLLLVLVISTLFLIKSPVSGVSALTGGLIYLLPQTFFSLKAFSRTGGSPPHALIFGETIKLLLTGALFAAVFAVADTIDAMALLFTFVVMVSSHWLAPLGLRHRSSR